MMKTNGRVFIVMELRRDIAIVVHDVMLLGIVHTCLISCRMLADLCSISVLPIFGLFLSCNLRQLGKSLATLELRILDHT